MTVGGHETSPRVTSRNVRSRSASDASCQTNDETPTSASSITAFSVCSTSRATTAGRGSSSARAPTSGSNSGWRASMRMTSGSCSWTACRSSPSASFVPTTSAGGSQANDR